MTPSDTSQAIKSLKRLRLVSEGQSGRLIFPVARSALYWSKRSGRNRVSLASSVTSTLRLDNSSEQEIIEAVHALAATVDAKDHYTYGHSKFGVAILKHIKGLSGCLPIIQHHHEHFDGKGYPAGLAGDDIPLDSRILAVADAYDAMTSPRSYRPSKLTHQDALKELVRCKGTYFDPEVVRVFTELWKPLDLSELAGSYVR